MKDLKQYNTRRSAFDNEPPEELRLKNEEIEPVKPVAAKKLNQH